MKKKIIRKDLRGVVIGLVASSLMGACGQNHDSQVQEAWNDANNPAIMGIDHITGKYGYNNSLADLPLAAKLTKSVWSGDYWPTKLGGVAIRWNSQVMRAHPRITGEDPTDADVRLYASAIGYPLAAKTGLPNKVKVEELSPTEKYDIFVGSNGFALTRNERARTQIMKTIPGSAEFTSGYSIAGWEGICHAWAPATIHYDAMDAVTLTGADNVKIPFGASDVQALLAIFLNGAGASSDFLSGRCEIDAKELTAMIKDKKQLPIECRDSNPGAMHIVLANQIGLKNEGLVADVDKSAEVWNQGVVGYQSKIMQETTTIRPDAGKGTVKEVLVATTMYYVSEVAYAFKGKGAGNPFEKMEMTYWLELNDKGQIIGGEWADPAEQHPDFLWKYQSYPSFTGFWAPLEKIYQESVKAYKAAGYSADFPF